MTPRVALVGGGVFAARWFEALAAQPLPDVLDLALVGRDRRRTAAIAGHVGAALAATRPGWKLTATTSLEAGAADASVVILMARIGGLEARADDEALAVRHGMVGDEGLGIGGVANAWRTLPPLRAMAATLRRVAPRAVVLNLMAPLGVTTRALHEEGVAATGLCELPLVTWAAWRERLPGDGALDVDYAGLNHLGFFWPRGALGRRWLDALARESLVDAELLARCGGAPLHYYEELIEPAVGARRRGARAAGRARLLIDVRERALDEMERAPGCGVASFARRATPWFDQLVAPLVAALVRDEPFDGWFDVRNGGALPDLPADAVVELRGRLSREGAACAAPADVPRPIAAFLATAAKWEERCYRAARDRDRGALRDALDAWPGAWQRPPPRAVDELVATIAAIAPPEEPS